MCEQKLFPLESHKLTFVVVVVTAAVVDIYIYHILFSLILFAQKIFLFSSSSWWCKILKLNWKFFRSIFPPLVFIIIANVNKYAFFFCLLHFSLIFVSITALFFTQFLCHLSFFMAAAAQTLPKLYTAGKSK